MPCECKTYEIANVPSCVSYTSLAGVTSSLPGLRRQRSTTRVYINQNYVTHTSKTKELLHCLPYHKKSEVTVYCFSKYGGMKFFVSTSFPLITLIRHYEPVKLTTCARFNHRHFDPAYDVMPCTAGHFIARNVMHGSLQHRPTWFLFLVTFDWNTSRLQTSTAPN